MPVTRSRSAALLAAQINGGRRLRSSVRAGRLPRSEVKPIVRKRRNAASKRMQTTLQAAEIISDEAIASTTRDGTMTAGPRDDPQGTPDDDSIILQGWIDATAFGGLPPLPKSVVSDQFGKDAPMTGTPDEGLIHQPTSPAILVESSGDSTGSINNHPNVSATLDQVLVDVEGVLGRLSPGASYTVHITKRSTRDPGGRVVASARRNHKLNTRARISASRSSSNGPHIPEINPNIIEEGARMAEMVSDTRREIVAMGIGSSTVDTEKELLYMPEDGLPPHLQSLHDSLATETSEDDPNAGINSFSPSTVVGLGMAIIPYSGEATTVQQNNQGVSDPHDEEIMPHYEEFCAWWRLYGGAATRQPPENTATPVIMAESEPSAPESMPMIQNEIPRQLQPLLYTYDTWSPLRRQPNNGQLALQVTPTPTIRRPIQNRTVLTLEELMRGPEDTPPVPVTPTLSDKILWADTTIRSDSSIMSAAAIEVQDPDEDTTVEVQDQNEDAAIEVQDLNEDAAIGAPVYEEPGLPEPYDTNTPTQGLESTAPYSDPPEWPFF